tara:strand:+ start:557 stop:958 length:402 start_codon:yes stop_codon:yes gene_type:complete
MRHTIKDVLTQEEADGLSGYLSFRNNIVSRLLDYVRLVADVDISGEAYCRVEERKEGHPWHFDTGTNNHMLWCKWSASVLLTPPDKFTGGGFYFRDCGPLFHHLDLVLFSGDEHMVKRNSGGRKVLLMFLGEK